MQVLVLGAGQLARMMALAGAPLGIEVRAYDVRSHRVVHPLTWQDYGCNLSQGLAAAEVVTAEFEHIPEAILSESAASGKFLPGADAIRVGGDRRKEKALLDDCGVANAPYRTANTLEQLQSAAEVLGRPLILKSALEGYDGKGQWRIGPDTDLTDLWPEVDAFLSGGNPDQGLVVEQMIPFQREVSVIGARDKHGQVAIYPLTQNHHESGILALSMAPANEGNLQQQALEIFSRITNALDYVGVMAIELFDVEGQLLVNELAPRVHNSGHWTQQGAICCQFENHLRAVCGHPLGATELLRPTAMINIIGTDRVPDALSSIPDTHIHWYGKEKRPGRKMGHINVCATTASALQERLQIILKHLPESEFPGLNDAVAQFHVQE